MKHRIIQQLVYFLLFFGIPVSMIAQERKNITLREAVDLSLKNSRQVKLSEAKIGEATAALKEARDRKLPDASLSGSYLRLNNPTVDLKIKSNNSSGGSTGSAQKAVVNQAAYALANLSLPLFSGGRIRYGIESSIYLEQATKLDADNDRGSVIINTIEAYNNLYKAYATVAIVDSGLAEARQRVKEYSRLEQNGLMARNDLLKAQLQQSNIELSLLDAQNNWKMANVNMNIMLGMPDSLELIPDSASLNNREDNRTISDYLQLALQNRKDLAALDFRKKAALSGIKATKGEKYPSLAVTAGYAALDIPNALTVYNAVNLGLGLQYNIGSLWKTKAKVLQAEAREKQIEVNQDILGDAVHLQIYQAYQNFLLSRKKIDVYQTAILQAAENYKVTMNKFNNGLATVTDVLDADVARLQARLNLSFAQSDTYVSYNHLLQTAGLLTDQSNQTK
jgi:outer membrane protein